MNLIDSLDEIAYRAPARCTIRAMTLLAALRSARDAWTAAFERRRRLWMQIITWLAAAAFVLAYLLVCSYLERADLAVKNEEAARAIAALQRDKTAAEAALSELLSTRTHKLVFLIEADSTMEARDKLQRLSMMVAEEHFNLQEAIRGTKK